MEHKKLGIGVIGAGGIARTRTIPGILKSELAELSAIMDPSEEVLGRLKAQVGEVLATTSLEELLACPKVEAVYIASPVFAHLEQVKACAEAGKHVLVEKPIARTVEEAEEMLRVCREAGIKAGTAFMMRFHTYHQQIRELIASGALGQIVSGRVQQIFWYPEAMNPQGDALVWRQIKALSGGGALMDVGVHNIDLAEFLSGSRTAEITGFVNTRSFSYDVDDICNLLIRLENGAVFYIDGAFNTQGTPGGNLLEIYGTAGSLLLQGSVGQSEEGELRGFLIKEGADGKPCRSEISLMPDFSDLYTKEVDGFVQAILTGGPEPVPMEQGLWIQKVARAAYEASQTGRCVKVATL